MGGRRVREKEEGEREEEREEGEGEGGGEGGVVLMSIGHKIYQCHLTVLGK